MAEPSVWLTGIYAHAKVCPECGEPTFRAEGIHANCEIRRQMRAAKECGHTGWCACVKRRQPVSLDAYYKSEHD